MGADKSLVQDIPLLVIGVSVGRTGTMSLKAALEILYGMPCYHMIEMINKHRNHIKLWSHLFDLMERDPNIDLPDEVISEIFRGYQLVTDNPGCTIYKQLMKLYPEAKLILTVRNPNTWIQSIRETVRPKEPIFGTGWLNRLRELIFIAPGFGRMTDQSMRLALGGNVDLTDDDQMIRGFVHRIEEVKRVVPAERLLVFEVKDGWGPLCRFLNKPIPNVPFPRVNDRKEMQKRLKNVKTLINTVLFVSAVSIGLIAVVGAILFVSRV
ncbi:Nad dependent epimerase dehydratase [Fasciola hepatica]|uniref:Nad dependent epimerase dehydratase n=1 Tax=Fasciola hepatica TaxID=6192 RepID=A0A4E0RCM9_FASHE|nr:Nad dependent epimerase dehydratase [Fasciola hepatica]